MVECKVHCRRGTEWHPLRSTRSTTASSHACARAPRRTAGRLRTRPRIFCEAFSRRRAPENGFSAFSGRSSATWAESNLICRRHHPTGSLPSSIDDHPGYKRHLGDDATESRTEGFGLACSKRPTGFLYDHDIACRNPVRGRALASWSQAAGSGRQCTTRFRASLRPCSSIRRGRSVALCEGFCRPETAGSSPRRSRCDDRRHRPRASGRAGDAELWRLRKQRPCHSRSLDGAVTSPEKAVVLETIYAALKARAAPKPRLVAPHPSPAATPSPAGEESAREPVGSGDCRARRRHRSP